MNVAFLFGAGVENGGNFGLPLGNEFMQCAFFDHLSSKMEAIGKYFSGNYFGDKYKYIKSSFSIEKVIFKNLLSYYFINEYEDDFDKKYSKVIRAVFSEYEIGALGLDEKLLDDKDSDIKDFISWDVLKKEIDDFFKTGKNTVNDLLLNRLLKLNTNYSYIGGALDPEFHTIVNPKKYGPKKFSWVFNYYWSCYFSILDGVLKFFKVDNPLLEKYFDEMGRLRYSYVLDNIKTVTNELYSAEFNLPNGSYYKHIKDRINDKRFNGIGYECNGIITTNYFRFCEKIFTENGSEKVAYVNGQLKWFEFPELLEVHDLCDDEIPDNKLFFPFIFGQSMVKPIVHPLQTYEYNRADSILDKANILVILGFNLTDDDNHLNALLHKFLLGEQKKVIICSEKEDEAAYSKLRCNYNDKIDHCLIDYSADNSENVNKIFQSINSKF